MDCKVGWCEVNRDQVQMIAFFKNIAIAGGFLLLAATGAGASSIDRRLAR
jgi:putative oxidoreductase